MTPDAVHHVSPCCGAAIYVAGTGATHWYQCQRCLAPVEPVTREEWRRINAARAGADNEEDARGE